MHSCRLVCIHAGPYAYMQARSYVVHMHTCGHGHMPACRHEHMEARTHGYTVDTVHTPAVSLGKSIEKQRF